MALVDDVTIKIKAGKGGDGARGFKTNYGSMKTVPDGGDGGNGGDVYFEGTSNLNDLSEFRYRKSIKAEDGVRGGKNNLTGAKGQDITILVPLGTTIIDVVTQEKVEILTDKKRVPAAYGGRGGLGNSDPTVRMNKYGTPIHSLLGLPGDERELHLILNLIADIGLVGHPNAGKSSLLQALTNATPKIGNYPFTTLEPSLGTMSTSRGTITLADIPGLIEGASQGKGLGIEFLKHIEKTKILAHCIDSTGETPYETYKEVEKEFEEYGHNLVSKKEIILLTKIDLIDEKELKKKITALKKTKRDIYTVSVYDEKSIEELKKTLEACVNTQIPEFHIAKADKSAKTEAK